MCRFYLLLAGADKETAFCLWFLFWLHQGRIPHRMCRFYLFLAGAVGKRQGIFDPLSLSNTSPDPFGDPLRRGISAAAVDRDIDSLYPVQVVYPHFDVVFGCLVFGLRSLAFQSVLLGCGLSFFIGGGWAAHSCDYVRFGFRHSGAVHFAVTLGFAISFAGPPLP